jgi:hypothetical protein
VPDDVTRNTKAALKKLAETIKGRERVIDRRPRKAMRTVIAGGSGHKPIKQQKLTFRMVDALRAQVRIGESRDPEPSAGLLDSQSIKGADSVGASTRGSRDDFVVGLVFRRHAAKSTTISSSPQKINFLVQRSPQFALRWHDTTLQLARASAPVAAKSAA